MSPRESRCLKDRETIDSSLRIQPKARSKIGNISVMVWKQIGHFAFTTAFYNVVSENPIAIRQGYGESLLLLGTFLPKSTCIVDSVLGRHLVISGGFFVGGKRATRATEGPQHPAQDSQ